MTDKASGSIEFIQIKHLADRVTTRQTVPIVRAGLPNWVSLGDLPNRGEGDVIPRKPKPGDEGTAFEIGDVLIGRLEPSRQRVWCATFSGFCMTSTIIVVRPRPRVDGRYLSQVLLSPQVLNELMSQSAGVGMTRLTYRALSQVEIPVPVLPEQERWIGLLQDVQSSRIVRQQIRRAVDELLGVVFQRVFNMNDRVPIRDLLIRVQQGVAKETRDRPVRGSEQGLLLAKSVEHGIFNPRFNEALKSGQKIAGSETLSMGDLLFCHTGPSWHVGNLAMVDANFSNFAASEQLWRIVPQVGLPNSFLKGMFSTRMIREQLKSLAATSSIAPKSRIGKREFLAQMGVAPTTSGLMRYDAVFQFLMPTLTRLRIQAEELERLPTAIRVAMVQGKSAPRERHLPDAHTGFVEPERSVWKRLSKPQQYVWKLVVTQRAPLTVDSLMAAMDEQHKKKLHEEHLLAALELLVTLGVIVRGGQRDVETWRVPEIEEREVIR